MTRRALTQGSVENARKLRKRASMPERVLWSRLRGKQCCGLKFRRQYAVGDYVVDFYCAEVGLVVEVDGMNHEERAEHDRARDAYLRSAGLRVLRVSVSDVSKDVDVVLRLIAREAGKEG